MYVFHLCFKRKPCQHDFCFCKHLPTHENIKTQKKHVVHVGGDRGYISKYQRRTLMNMRSDLITRYIILSIYINKITYDIK